MELRDHLVILRQRWLSLLMVILATLAVTALVTASLTPRYTASTRMFFDMRGGESVGDVAQGSVFVESRMSSYAQIVTSLDPRPGNPKSRAQ